MPGLLQFVGIAAPNVPTTPLFKVIISGNYEHFNIRFLDKK